MKRTLSSVLAAVALGGCTATIEGGPADREHDPSAPAPAPTPPSSDAFGCNARAERVGPARIWRLTAAQYNNTVTRLFGVALPAIGPDNEEIFRGGQEAGFLNGAFALRVQEPQAGQIRKLARAIAEKVVADPAALRTTFASGPMCPPGSASYAQASCVGAFVQSFGLRAFRRPLSSEEAAGLTRLFMLARAQGEHFGVRAVLEAVLQSPSFLYRTELPAGTGKSPLPPYDLASALSYFLTDGPPDADLMAAAARDELETPAQMEAQARRLLAAGGRPAVAELYRQWLGYEDLKTRTKDETAYPQWEKVRLVMAEELRRFVESVVFDGGGRWKDLFDARHTFVDADLAPIYGARPEPGWRRIETDGRRAGLLTLSGLMAITSELDRTSPVARGLLVQERMFCTHIADPPEGADTSLPAPPAGASRRQQLEAKTSPPLCVGCHGLINGIGFGLETLDGIGRHREHDNGVPIDPRGTIKGTRDSDGDFAGPAGLAGALVASRQSRECFTTQVFRYALGRGETVGDACSLARAYGDFRSAGDDIKALLVAIAKTEAFRSREVQP